MNVKSKFDEMVKSIDEVGEKHLNFENKKEAKFFVAILAHCYNKYRFIVESNLDEPLVCDDLIQFTTEELQEKN